MLTDTQPETGATGMDVPFVATLRMAVDEVVRNNLALDYPPTRFVQKTEGLKDGDLVHAVTGLVTSDTAKTALMNAFKKHPDLWTVEDFVVLWGSTWNLPDEAVSEAKERVALFDVVRHFYREQGGA